MVFVVGSQRDDLVVGFGVEALENLFHFGRGFYCLFGYRAHRDNN
jgi:hypothetical protein